MSVRIGTGGVMEVGRFDNLTTQCKPVARPCFSIEPFLRQLAGIVVSAPKLHICALNREVIANKISRRANAHF